MDIHVLFSLSIPLHFTFLRSIRGCRREKITFKSFRGTNGRIDLDRTSISSNSAHQMRGLCRHQQLKSSVLSSTAIIVGKSDYSQRKFVMGKTYATTTGNLTENRPLKGLKG